VLRTLSNLITLNRAAGEANVKRPEREAGGRFWRIAEIAAEQAVRVIQRI